MEKGKEIDIMRATKQQPRRLAEVQREQTESINYVEALRLARHTKIILNSMLKYADESTRKLILRELSKMHGHLRKDRHSRRDRSEISLDVLQRFERVVVLHLRKLLRTSAAGMRRH